MSSHTFRSEVGAVPTESDLLDLALEAGIRDIASVPCSVTSAWDTLVARRAREGALRFDHTSHEGNLPGIAAGVWFATGRPALVHLQNSGLCSAGDGFVSFASPETYGIPMAVLVTWRGWGPEDDSEPHQAVGVRTEALTDAIFGAGSCIAGGRDERDILGAARRALAAAFEGRMGVLRLSPCAFRNATRPELHAPQAPQDPAAKERQRALKGRPSLPESLRFAAPPDRDTVLRAIVEQHPDAAILFCNGFTARAAQAVVDRAGNFYNAGYMGGTLAVGWGLATRRPDLEVVVVDGDQNALMSSMKDHLEAEYPPNLHWYVLDNGIGASVGAAASLPLGPAIHRLARVIETRPDVPGSFRHPRVRPTGAVVESIPPESRTHTLHDLADGFRRWIAAKG